MRRIILKTSAFIVILVAFNRLFWVWLPVGWENPNLHDKERVYFERYANETNTLFFGSSRTFAQIDPTLFDQLNNANAIETHSYMLASSAVYFNELFLHLEAFFEKPGTYSNLEYVFIELNHAVVLNRSYLFTPRQSYYITPGIIGKCLRQVAAQDLTLSKTVEATYDYLASMIVDLTHLGYGNAKIETMTASDPSDSTWIHGKGHYALTLRNPTYRNGVYLERHNALMADTSVISKGFQRIDSVCKISTDAGFNPLVYQKFLDLFTRFDTHGIQLVIMLPLNKAIDGELMSLYNALPEGHKINLCAVANEIPELHRTDHWFDTGHINDDGVLLLTTAFTQEFQRLIAQSQR